MSKKKEEAVTAQQRAARARVEQINRQKRTQLASTEGVDFSHGLPSEQAIEYSEQQRVAQQASRQRVTANTRIDQVSVADLLFYTSREANKNLPQQVDNEKVLETTTASYDTLLYRFRFIDDSIVKHPMFKKEEYLKHVHRSLCGSTCTDQSTLSLLQRGAKYNYLFVDRTGMPLFDYTLDAGECGQCGKGNSADSSRRESPFKTDNANNTDDIVTLFKFIALILLIYTVSSVLVSKWKEEDSFRETVKYNLIYYLFSFVAAIFLTLRMDYEFVDHLYLILLATALICWLWHLLQAVIVEIIGSESVFRAIGIILFIAFFIWSLLNGGDSGPESYWEQQAGN